MYARLTLNSLCSKDDLKLPVPCLHFPSTRITGMCVTIQGVYRAIDQTQGFVQLILGVSYIASQGREFQGCLWIRAYVLHGGLAVSMAVATILISWT